MAKEDSHMTLFGGEGGGRRGSDTQEHSYLSPGEIWSHDATTCRSILK